VSSKSTRKEQPSIQNNALRSQRSTDQIVRVAKTESTMETVSLQPNLLQSIDIDGKEIFEIIRGGSPRSIFSSKSFHSPSEHDARHQKSDKRAIAEAATRRHQTSSTNNLRPNSRNCNKSVVEERDSLEQSHATQLLEIITDEILGDVNESRDDYDEIRDEASGQARQICWARHISHQSDGTASLIGSFDLGAPSCSRLGLW